MRDGSVTFNCVIACVLWISGLTLVLVDVITFMVTNRWLGIALLGLFVGAVAVAWSVTGSVQNATSRVLAMQSHQEQPPGEARVHSLR